MARYSFGAGRPSGGPQKTRLGSKRRNASFTPQPQRQGQTRLGTGGTRPGQNKPAQKPKPAAKPPRPGAPKPDSSYYRDIDRINTHETEGLSSIAGNRQNVTHEYGIDDPTNPFSRAQGLKKAYLNRRKAASAGLASQGQLYSGAHERALARTRSEEEQAYNELRSAYNAALSGLSEQERETRYGSETERDAAFKEWLDRSPEADAGPEAKAPAAGSAAKPAPKPKPQAQLVDKAQLGPGNKNSSALTGQNAGLPNVGAHQGSRSAAQIERARNRRARARARRHGGMVFKKGR